MTISMRTVFMIVIAGAVCDRLTISKNAHGEISEAPGANTACEQIQRNGDMSIAIHGKAITVALVNRNLNPLWISTKRRPTSYRIDAGNKTATISYGYFDGHVGARTVANPILERMGQKPVADEGSIR